MSVACNLCPRKCNIDRTSAVGYCQMGADVMVARADLHMWEETCISGKEGSGTIFFSGCNLKCVYCQNHEISAGGKGVKITTKRLAELMLELEDKKANNINLVTGNHFIDQICESIRIARDNGLSIPIVYNTSSYENVESLRLLEGVVDVYLPDFKYYDDALAVRYSNAPQYCDIATRAIDEMVRQCGGSDKETYDSRGIIKRGVIVRHMVLPSHTKDSMKVLEHLHRRYGDDISISIMSQYTPVNRLDDYPEIGRTITRREYAKVCDFAIDIGIEKGYFQEGGVALESFIPEFDFLG